MHIEHNIPSEFLLLKKKSWHLYDVNILEQV